MLRLHKAYPLHCDHLAPPSDRHVEALPPSSPVTRHSASRPARNNMIARGNWLSPDRRDDGVKSPERFAPRKETNRCLPGPSNAANG
jgi:hypothetical protein